MSNFLDYEGLKVFKGKDDELYLTETKLTNLPTSSSAESTDVLIKGDTSSDELTNITVEDFIEAIKPEILADSKYISGTEIAYQISSDGSTAPSGEWSDEPEEATSGEYLWTRVIFTYNNGTSDTFYMVSRAGVDGEKGENGVALYGTCSTTATMPTKVISCSDIDSLYTGLSIVVKFTNANTADAPNLSIETPVGTYVCNIYVNGAIPSSTNPFKWGANTYISFVYDGSYWVPTNKAGSFYGTGSVEEATVAKTITINDFILQVGTTVMLSSETANTADEPTLNVSGTGSYPIWYNDEAGFLWDAGETITLEFDGSYWQIVGNVDTVTTDEIDLLFDSRISDSVIYFYEDEASVSGTELAVTIDSDNVYVSGTVFYIPERLDLILGLKI